MPSFCVSSPHPSISSLLVTSIQLAPTPSFPVMADPSLEIHPSFTSDAFHHVCEVLMDAFNLNAKQVTEHLTTTWDVDHNEQVEA